MCKLEQFKSEASEKGLTLLGKSNSPESYLYRFNSCGHTKEYKPYELRNTNPVCNECKLEQFKLEAKEKGLTLLHKSDKRSHYWYQFDKCGHQKEYKPSHVRRRQPTCESCQIEQFKFEAKEKGLTLIRKAEKFGNYVYQFDKCGHQKEYQAVHVRKKQPHCEICQFEQFKLEADQKDMSIISKGTKTGYYLYQFNDCGHQKEYQPSDIRHKSVCCEFCGNSHFHQKTYVYLLLIHNEENSFLKLGVANNILSRQKNYKLDKSYTIEELDSVLVDTKFIALEYEKNIHSNYISNNLDHSIMNEIMASGYTECYPVILEKALLAEIDLIKIKEKELQKVA